MSRRAPLRVALVAPTASDPAHRRVLGALARELRRLGQRPAVFRPRPGPARGEARRLERFLARTRADVCHAQFFTRGLTWLAAARLPAGVRLVVTYQGASLDLIARPERFRALAARADRLTTVSREAAARLRRFLGRRSPRPVVIANGADAASPGARTRRPFVLAVSRLAAYKGVDLLLLAFAALAPRHPRLDLIVCGPDQTGGKLAAFAGRLGLADRVRFPGNLSPARVRGLLERCLLFVLPSREENLPMALLEALAAGKAAVACRVGGVPEIAAHGRSAWLVPPRDPAALAGALERLLRSPRLRRRLGATARRRARAFTWRAVAREYLRLYQHFSSNRR